MLQNYLKIAYRNLKRNPTYASINIVGLALGISTFIFIMQYVGSEFSVNKFHTNIDNIYRVTNLAKDGNRWLEVAPGWGPLAKTRLKEVDDYCRVAEGVAQGVVRNAEANMAYREEGIAYGEGNFFDFFSFELVEGTKDQLNSPNSVFLSASSAKKYFKEQSPIDKQLQLNNQFGTTNYTVKGVYKDMDQSSDMKYDMVFSLETLKTEANLNGNSWANLNNFDSGFIITFLSSKPKVDFTTFEQNLIALNKEFNKEDDAVEPRLQPLKHMHIAKDLGDELPTYASITYVYILAAIAFLILIIAWLNYINLSTATSLKRATEVGIKKAIGASKTNVIAQFLVETSLINFIAFGLAGVVIVLIQPWFNQIIGRDTTLMNLEYSSLWLLALGAFVVGSLLSGLYTAFIVSEFNLIAALKGSMSKGKQAILVRKGLVVFQFAISVGLVMATTVIYRQLQYVNTEKLGFNDEQIMVVNGPLVDIDSTFNRRNAGFKNFLEQQTYVSSLGTSNSIPSKFYNFKTSGFTHPKSLPEDKLKSYAFLIIGEQFLPTYEIPVKAGRNFTEAECDVEWNSNSKVMINENALKFMGFSSVEEAMAEGIQWDERHLDIIGIVGDYHHSSLHFPIEPMIFYPQNASGYYSIRLTPDRISDKIASISMAFNEAFPGNPFEYSFTDQNFAKAYAEDKRFGKLFSTAALLALFIACLGLFGLATFTVELRTKEIGLRKVLGASVMSVVTLISKDFIKLIVIALFVGIPLAWYGMNSWLDNFTFHVEIEWWLALFAGSIVITLALITVSYKSLKASIINPVESLRND